MRKQLRFHVFNYGKDYYERYEIEQYQKKHLTKWDKVAIALLAVVGALLIWLFIAITFQVGG